MTVLPAGKVKYIHVSQPAIRANIKAAKKQPVLRVKYDGKNYCGDEIEVTQGRFLYSAEKAILSCGARLVFKTTDEVRIYNKPRRAARPA